jgi:predicted Rossmann fold nucleotide-binding protein DprA/Smf involved in DNA uptake
MSFILTSEGELKARQVKQDTGPEDAIVSFMYRVVEPVEFDEICDETQMDSDSARNVLNRLKTQGYIEEKQGGE